LDFDVMAVFSKEIDKLPHFGNALLCARFEPVNGTREL
jgi:hypothetical protein